MIYPVLVMAGTGQKEAIPSMPGCYRYTLDLLLDEVTAVHDLGIPGIALLPLISSDLKGHPFTRHLGQSRGIGYRRRRADEALYSWGTGNKRAVLPSRAQAQY